MKIRHAQSQPAHQKHKTIVDDFDDPPPLLIGRGLADHYFRHGLPGGGPKKRPNEPKEEAEGQGIFDEKVPDARPGGEVEAGAWLARWC